MIGPRSSHIIPRWSSSVRAGRGVLFFLVHGIGGEVLSYAPLAKHLSAARSIYGLQGRSFGAGTIPRGSG